jgi:hypothetical protein
MTRESEVKKTAISTRHLIIGAILIIVIVVSIGALWAWHQEQLAQNLVNSSNYLTPTSTPYYVPVPTPTPYYAPIPTPTLSLPSSKPDFTITGVQTPILCYQTGIYEIAETMTITSINSFSGQVFITSSWIGTQPTDVSVSNGIQISASLSYNMLISPNGVYGYSFYLNSNYPYGSMPSIGDYTLQITVTGNGISHSVDILLEIYAPS